MNLEELRQRVECQEKFDWLFFWGHKQPRDGRVSASCLSQWFPAPFEVEGVGYPTAEHWMMAEKARLFGDAECLARILAAESPAAAKSLGRKVRGFDEERWVGHRFSMVVAGNRHKFSQNRHLAGFLRSTGAKVLVEASPVDRIWGIGLGKDDPDAQNPSSWRGLNLLGFALMEVREQL